MTSCILILAYVLTEYSYDRFHQKADRIYRLVESGFSGDRPLEVAVIPAPWAPALVETFPEIQYAVRFRKPNGAWLISRNDKRHYEEGFFFADSTVFDVFSFELIHGDPLAALSRPYTVVLTESSARKYFGDEDAMGKTIKGENRIEFMVTGIMRDLPAVSHMHFDFLASFATLAPERLYGEPSDFTSGGFNHHVYTYLLLHPGASPDVVTRRLPEFLEKHIGHRLKNSGIVARPYLQALTDIHLHSNLDAELALNGDILSVRLFSVLAGAILVIACLNFINLSTARTTDRELEIGVRKVVGADRFQLIQQFLGESLLTAGLCLLISIVLVRILLPFFPAVPDTDLNLVYRNGWFIAGLLIIVITTGLLAGFYPALLLSGLRPISILQGARHAGTRNYAFRKLLVVIQFAIAATLIIGTLGVSRQIEYLRTHELGFQKDRVAVARLQDRYLIEGYPVLKTRLLQHPEILGVTSASGIPGGLIPKFPMRPEDAPQEMTPMYSTMIVEQDFIKTMGIDMVMGRDFSDKPEPEAASVCLINEAMKAQLGWENPLEKRFISTNGMQYRIIGVVRDFHVQSLHYPIQPLILIPSPGTPVMLVRLREDAFAQGIDALRAVWQESFPNYPDIAYSFLDDDFNRLYHAEHKQETILALFTFLSILVACLGVWGLASFVVSQRTKEIGIRKILGASVTHINALLLKEFTTPVVLGWLIAAPLAFLLIQQWLQVFAYRTDPGIWNFPAAGLLVFAVVWCTVAVQTFKAARANPADSLRYE